MNQTNPARNDRSHMSAVKSSMEQSGTTGRRAKMAKVWTSNGHDITEMKMSRFIFLGNQKGVWCQGNHIASYEFDS